MSDKVKLIIEIPKETYKSITADKYAIYDKMYYSIKNGIPLNNVKAEIQDLYVGYRDGYEIMADVLHILNCIGKESEDVVVTNKNLCDSCTTKNCIFQSGIVRNHCDFYKAESEDKE